MVRHTLSTLGPKVLASRMVHDYVLQLYTPAAVSARATQANNFALAKDLAAWKQKVRRGWSRVEVEHVDAHGIGDDPQLGGDFTVHADVLLGQLTPEDVCVQVVAGRVDADDRLVNPRFVEMNIESEDGERRVYSAAMKMDITGPFGYTVRAVPAHPGLASLSELGLAASPA